MFWQMTLRASVQLSVEPLEEGYPLGEIRLGPGVVEPALARLVAGETVAQRGGAGVYLFHVPHGKGEAQRRRSVRQGRFPEENLISQSLLPVIFGIFTIMRIIASLTQSSCPKQLLISIIKLLRSTEQR